ncbi:hypothetical protein BY996DRAFT_6500846 [Phakopsora pachyrhizi]|nr:hypothetical protein BY996DRAFT_6500846 [Phakopsora pachyrhizi]
MSKLYFSVSKTLHSFIQPNNSSFIDAVDALSHAYRESLMLNIAIKLRHLVLLRYIPGESINDHNKFSDCYTSLINSFSGVPELMTISTGFTSFTNETICEKLTMEHTCRQTMEQQHELNFDTFKKNSNKEKRKTVKCLLTKTPFTKKKYYDTDQEIISRMMKELQEMSTNNSAEDTGFCLTEELEFNDSSNNLQLVYDSGATKSMVNSQDLLNNPVKIHEHLWGINLHHPHWNYEHWRYINLSCLLFPHWTQKSYLNNSIRRPWSQHQSCTRKEIVMDNQNDTALNNVWMFLMHNDSKSYTYQNKIVLGSGATNHFISDKSLFQNLTYEDLGTDVLWVPDLNTNLISLGKLMNQGCFIHTKTGNQYEIMKEGKFFITGIFKNNLPILTLSYDQALKIASGILDSNTLKEVSSKSFEHLHVDICGPITPCLRKGNQFILTIIDNYSGYINGYPLSKKGQAEEVRILTYDDNIRRRGKTINHHVGHDVVYLNDTVNHSSKLHTRGNAGKAVIQTKHIKPLKEFTIKEMTLEPPQKCQTILKTPIQTNPCLRKRLKRISLKVEKAVICKDKEFWEEAINKELSNIQDMKVLEPYYRPPTANVGNQ